MLCFGHIKVKKGGVGELWGDACRVPVAHGLIDHLYLTEMVGGGGGVFIVICLYSPNEMTKSYSGKAISYPYGCPYIQ